MISLQNGKFRNKNSLGQIKNVFICSFVQTEKNSWKKMVNQLLQGQKNQWVLQVSKADCILTSPFNINVCTAFERFLNSTMYF